MPSWFFLIVLKQSKGLMCCLAMLTIILFFYTKPIFADTQKEDKGFLNLQTSVYTKHFNPKKEHNNNQDLIGIDYNQANGWFYGGATFRNSHRQRTYYIYGGKRFELKGTPFFSRISGGLIHGYKGKYKRKIPMNDLGTAPAIIPSVGIQIKCFSAEVLLLGFNAMMVNVSYQYKL